MGRRLLRLFAGVLLAVLMPATVLAASVVDQKSESHDTYKVAAPDNLAQTFTVGLTGKLTAVDLFLYDWDGGPVLVFIESIDRKTKLPTGTVYASSSQSVVYEQWYHFPLNTPVSCSKGAQLAIVFYGGPNSTAGWTSTNAYAGGQALKVAGPWTPLGGDFAFRTYSEAAAPTPTPKPAATPTPKPAPTPTPKPAPTATPKPSTTATPTPALSTLPTASAATDPPAPTASPAAGDPKASATPAFTGAPSASAVANPNSSSTDPSGPALPLLIGGFVGAGLLAAGLGFAVGRRRPKSA